MSAASVDLRNPVVQAFPPWLDLPPGYIVNDWIAWEKGKLVAKRVRHDPSLIQVAIERLERRADRLFEANIEWLKLLQSGDVELLASILEAGDYEGQRLRSSTPFSRTPFIQPEEVEAIHERAYFG